MSMSNEERNLQQIYQKNQLRKILILIVLAGFTFVLFLIALMVGTSNLSFGESFLALFGQGDSSSVRIVLNIRLPRALAGLIAGAGLSLSGLMMQTTLNNTMASPSTLGVSNAAVLGANIGIVLLSGGMVDTNGGVQWSYNPYAISVFAFVFALGSILLVLALSKFKNFSPNTVVLVGVALGLFFTAITTLIQYFATDIQLSSAVYWTFGDLGRAGFDDVFIMLVPIAISFVFFQLFSRQYNALLLGDKGALSLGIPLSLFRFITLLLSSLICAVCISSLGIISFIGIIAPHIIKRFIGNDHKFLIPASLLSGSVILLFSDILARCLLRGTSLPVGAITAIIGAPFFLILLFTGKEKKI